MLARLLLQIVGGSLGIFLAVKFVPGVSFKGDYFTIILAGAAVGLVNFFVKPALSAITLPFRILTLGLLSVAINMVLVWLVLDVFFSPAIEISGLVPLFWTTAIIWILNFLLLFSWSKQKKK